MNPYFDPQQFIKDVIIACKLDGASAELLEQIKDAIFLRLSNRIISTVTSWMSEEEVQKFYGIMDQNPDLDPFDVLIQVAKNIPHMDKKLEKAIADLYEELTYDADRIDDAMKLRQAMDEMNEEESGQIISMNTFSHSPN